MLSARAARIGSREEDVDGWAVLEACVRALRRDGLDSISARSCFLEELQPGDSFRADVQNVRFVFQKFR